MGRGALFGGILSERVAIYLEFANNSRLAGGGKGVAGWGVPGFLLNNRHEISLHGGINDNKSVIVVLL